MAFFRASACPSACERYARKREDGQKKRNRVEREVEHKAVDVDRVLEANPNALAD
jgi:hypothetical protein